MMADRVAAIRAELPDTPIVAYSAKYASSFYGPFRDAAGPAPAFGDRRGYQLDPGNVREALRECELDAAEGADVLMIKPALPYLDVIRAARDRFELPLAAFNVSGEYAMVKAAAAAGDVDERAAEIVDSGPSVERVRLVSSGTEAAMSALRLARAFTRRDRVIVFEGGYHGHADPFLASAGSGLATLGIPSSPGVPAAVAAETIVVTYNDVDGVAAAVERYGEGLAAIFVEPVAGNMGCVPPAPGFLEALRLLCDAAGALLVFDEVITGFRVARGGAQERFGVMPDLTVLGKIVGGGLPLAAFGGRAEAMERLAPAGDVYQAGTLSGNPLATAAGPAVLQRLRNGSVYG